MADRHVSVENLSIKASEARESVEVRNDKPLQNALAATVDFLDPNPDIHEGWGTNQYPSMQMPDIGSDQFIATLKKLTGNDDLFTKVDDPETMDSATKIAFKEVKNREVIETQGVWKLEASEEGSEIFLVESTEPKLTPFLDKTYMDGDNQIVKRSSPQPGNDTTETTPLNEIEKRTKLSWVRLKKD